MYVYIYIYIYTIIIIIVCLFRTAGDLRCIVADNQV